jgi:hypothetical protein
MFALEPVEYVTGGLSHELEIDSLTAGRADYQMFIHYHQALFRHLIRPLCISADAPEVRTQLKR